MTDKELRKLKRVELLELLTGISEDNETLRSEKEELMKHLEDRKLQLEKAGSIAEASLQITGVFEQAERSATLYLENIERLNGETENITKQIMEDAGKEAEQIRNKARQEAEAMLVEARSECADMTEKTEKEIAAKWDVIEAKLKQYCTSHKELEDSLKLLYTQVH